MEPVQPGREATWEDMIEVYKIGEKVDMD